MTFSTVELSLFSTAAILNVQYNTAVGRNFHQEETEVRSKQADDNDDLNIAQVTNFCCETNQA